MKHLIPKYRSRFIAVSAPTLRQLGDKLDKIAKATNPNA